VAREDVIADPALLGRGALLEVLKDGEAYRGGLPGVRAKGFADTVARCVAGPPDGPPRRDA
jgi:hypothetical protein